jgi:hypothetical protein
MAGPWEKYQATAQPAAGGDPTVGYSPGVAPDRLAPDTMRAFAIDLMANNGKGAASILTQDPGAQYRRTYATTQGANAANLKYKQDMTNPLLDRIHDFENIGTKAGPDVLGLAIGPNYAPQDAKDNSFIHNTINDVTNLATGIYNGNMAQATGQDTASQAYQAQRAARYGSGDPNNPNKYDKALSANIEMQHLRDAIGSAVKALPGGSKGGSTDQDQALVLDMVGKALNAPTPDAFYKILHDAENTLRGRAGLSALPEQESYLPPQWSQAEQVRQANANRQSFLPPDQPAASGGFKYIGRMP